MQLKTGIRFWILSFYFFLGSMAYAQYTVSSPRQARPYSYSSGGKSGTLFDLGVYYSQSEATANPAAGNTWQNTTSIYDIKLGQVLSNNFYIGAMYTARSDNQLSSNTTSGNSVGVGLGYFTDNGFNLRAFYKFNESYGDYSDGTGYQAELGYMVNMTSNFYLGIALATRQTTFKTNKLITNFDYWTRKETYPFLTLGFLIN